MEEIGYKIITLGSYGVGKTCILLGATQEVENFPLGYQCTIGVDFKSKLFSFNNHLYKLTLWDTAGQERFYHINRLYYKDCDAVFLVFDVSNAQSFEKIRFFYDDYKKISNIESAYVMIGNKIDKETRAVTYAAACQLAKGLNMPYIECSAYTGQGIDDIFGVVIEEIQKNRGKKEKKSSSIVVEPNKKRAVGKCC